MEIRSKRLALLTQALLCASVMMFAAPVHSQDTGAEPPPKEGEAPAPDAATPPADAEAGTDAESGADTDAEPEADAKADATAEPSDDAKAEASPKDEETSEGAEAAPVKQSRHVFAHQNTSVLTLNPLGLANVSQFGYRFMLFPETESVLLKNTYVGFGLNPAITPAFGRLAAAVTLKPLAILQLTATYEGIAWFGTFDQLQTFPSPRVDASTAAREQNGEDGLNEPATGTVMSLAALLQAKVGPIAARANLKAQRFNVTALNEGDVAFYDIVSDTLAPVDGLQLRLDSDLFYLSGNLTAGVRHTMVVNQFKDSDFRDGEKTTDFHSPMHRVGPMILYKLWSKPDPTAGYNNPSVLVLIQWYAKHRYRAGQEFNQALPYVVVGYRFDGQFL